MSEAKDKRTSKDVENQERDRADPTEAPEFQKVVGYFLRTPAKPRGSEKPELKSTVSRRATKAKH